jgi:hypothetical protein
MLLLLPTPMTSADPRSRVGRLARSRLGRTNRAIAHFAARKPVGPIVALAASRHTVDPMSPLRDIRCSVAETGP